jgi:hypothetical protein
VCQREAKKELLCIDQALRFGRVLHISILGCLGIRRVSRDRGLLHCSAGLVVLDLNHCPCRRRGFRDSGFEMRSRAG